MRTRRNGFVPSSRHGDWDRIKRSRPDWPKSVLHGGGDASFEQAAAVAGRWEWRWTRSSIGRCSRRRTGRAASPSRLAPVRPCPRPRRRPRRGAVIMMDAGWCVIGRGLGFETHHGTGRAGAWQECKSAVIYRLARRPDEKRSGAFGGKVCGGLCGGTAGVWTAGAGGSRGGAWEK